VMRTLLDEGVALFMTAFDELLAGIEMKAQRLREN
jgi:hypothetical protein